MYTTPILKCTSVHRQAVLGKKIKLMRLAEELSGPEFAQLVDISIDAVKSYESERRKVAEQNLLKITNHPRFQKYALWLMTDQVAPAAGQVSPVMESEEARTG